MKHEFYNELLLVFQQNPEHMLRVAGIKGKVCLQKNQLNMCCPFHDDKQPSFSISLVTGQWICFSGCGSGNLITLLSKI